MKNKIPELQNILYNNLPKLLLVTETWISDEKGITNNLLDPEQQFTVIRNDRKSGNGGGVCAFVSSSLKSIIKPLSNIVINQLNDINCEIICFDIFVCKSTYRFILLYKPPNSCFGTAATLRKAMDLIILALSELTTTQLTTFICGDFNLPHINWACDQTAFDGVHNLFYDFVNSLGMTQFVLHPTRFSPSGTSTTLDLIFSNDDLAVDVSNYLTPFSTSDHLTLEFSVFFPNPPLTSGLDHTHDIAIYDWDSADFDSINSQLISFNWHAIFGYNFDVNTIWTAFKNVIWPIIDCYVPKKVIPQNKKYKVRQYPKHIRNLLTRKSAIWRTLKNNRTPETKLKYHTISKKCKLAIQSFDAERERKLLENNNLGAFYKFVNKKLSSSTGIAPLKNTSGILLTEDADKANLLNSYFQSVFTHDNGNIPPFPSRFSAPLHHTTINDVHITPQIISRIVQKLKPHSSAGPDRLPPIFFLKTKLSLSSPLAIIFRTFIDLHDLPTEWKSSIITPKFKKGSPSDPSNYRPISLTCTCCKILERIIVSDIIDFLQTHNLISKHQHGFLKHHSTLTNLTESLHDWTLSFSNHTSVVIAYIDFQRAFDSISHKKLIQKLISYGIDGNLLFWIKSFLSNRTQSVKVGLELSTISSVTSGVPQGSVLGPLLFNIFINDITDNFDHNVQLKLFADDLKLYTDLILPNSEFNFQTHLDIISNWSTTWQINISHSKCNILEISKQPTHTTFYVSNTPIAHSNIVKDLGINMQSNLQFDQHISEISKRANQRAFLILRSFISRNPANLSKAFTSYVRPLVEFSSPIWSPSKLYLINVLENVQRRFSKRIPGLKNLSYAERLKKLKLTSLEHRRLIADLVFCYKINHGFSSIKPQNLFIPSNNPSLRGHKYRLIPLLCKNNTHKFFFPNRVVKPWNSLPSIIAEALNVKSFKKLLSRHNLTSYLTHPTIHTNSTVIQNPVH